MVHEWHAAELAGALAEHAWLVGNVTNVTPENWTITEEQGQAVFTVEGIDFTSTTHTKRTYRVIVEEVDEP